ncbi:MAG TPA: glycosyltransferase family A protein [Aliidongia sp.]|nr:glycosyltransferase family A protein [Aliidongia sp.]
MQPRLSVVVPTRDCLDYLPAALASLRAQAIADLQIVVVDDGSTDGTAAYLAAEAAADPRLTVVTRGGGGVAAARNAGIAAATAPIIGFLDADDVWRLGAVADRLAAHEADPGLVLSFADYEHVTPDGTGLGTCFAFWPRFNRFVGGRRGILPLGNRALPLLYAENVVGTSTVFARRAALEAEQGFSTEFTAAEDWELWLRLARRGRVACSTMIATTYLVRPGSLSRDRPAVIRCMKQVAARYGAAAALRAPSAWLACRSRIAAAEAEHARIGGRKPVALAQHLLALALAPSRRLARAAAFDGARLLGLR